MSEADRVATDFEVFVKNAVAQRGLVALPLQAARVPAVPGLAWWAADVATAAPGARPVAIGEMVQKATQYSLQIGTFGTLPAIRDTAVDEAKGRYAPEFFAEARTSERNERTTALSQTGGDERLRESENVAEFGLRSRLRTGAEVTLSQRFSNLDSNVIFYNPALQSRSRTALSVVQPLIRGAGVLYGTAVERVAGYEAEAARNEFQRQAESHLLEVIRAYWVLYLARSNYAQEKRAAGVVDDLAAKLTRRLGIDAQPLQVSRAKAVASERAAGLVRSANAVRNAEARLKALTNDPVLTATGAPGLVPGDRPVVPDFAVDTRALVETAMASRPEVRSAFLAYRSALLREGMARSERMPQLDLVLEGSANGGNNSGAMLPSFGDGWANQGSYTAGLRFSVPLGPNERGARHQRRRLETMQQALQARTTIDTVVLELEVSANELVTAGNELARRGEALRLATSDQQIVTDRWQSGLAASGGGASEGIFYLDQLLGGQDRLTRAELDYAEAEATAMVAVANLSRVRGTLLADLGYAIEAVPPAPGTADLPRYRLARSAAR